ncbi:vomeronasal 1 receptor ornAnaV1R3043 [Ornithorhynchus anatinus]|uniref:Vomeronasal type-1 receptor n=1 Tax=Ornithorhynchus anatinus TaxID=9258 RepID=A0A6I8P939_ORNAN|nr:vomeronasal 1 receptor ornAnaV1R3043 [Ornithorhynchus anatinus]
MLWSDLIFTICFFLQIVIGLLANSTLLIVYVSSLVAQPRWRKPRDLILMHLTMANIVIFLTQCVPGIVMAFGWKPLGGTIGCQITLLIRRVARALSICTTCVLGVFQAITISPSNSWWKQLKPRIPNYILPSFVFFWILNILVEVNINFNIIASKNITIQVRVHSLKSCLNTLPETYVSIIQFITVITLRDIFFVFLMSWASGYMVIVLHQHRKRVKHIHHARLSPKSSPECRATHTILFLIISFVCFYCINSGITLTVSLLGEDAGILFDLNMFLGSCFSFFCPLVLISNDPRVPWPQWALKKLRNVATLLDLRNEQ